MSETTLPNNLQDRPAVIAAAIGTTLALVRETRVAADCAGGQTLSRDQEHALLIVAQVAAQQLESRLT